MTTILGCTRRAVATALLAIAPFPLVAQQPSPAELLTLREIDDLARPVAHLSDEVLDQMLRLLAERPAWAIAMGRAYRHQPGDLRAAIENQRRIAVVTVPVLTPMPAPVIPVAPTVVTPPPVVVQQPTIVVPNPVFAPPTVIVHAPPIVRFRPWTLWPWTRTIVERPIYITRDRNDRARDDRGREDRGREGHTREERAAPTKVTPRPSRTAIPRSSVARTP